MRYLLVALAVAGAAASARAQDAPAAPPRMDGLLGNFSLGGNRGPVNVAADQMEFDYKTMVLTYRGNVVVTQADMTLRANSLRVTLAKEGQQRAKEVVAEGDVRIDAGERHASGGKAVFDDAKRTVTLSDQARLSDGPNEVAGDRVVVFIDEQRSVVEGGPERVRAVLYPPTERPKQTAGDGNER
jgi:lipopolysaccharide export system protein LptA